MKRRCIAAVLVAGIFACGTTDDVAHADAPGTAARPAAVPANPPETMSGPSSSSDVIRDVRVNPGTTTVEIAFTSVPGAFASVVIGPTPPHAMALPAALARETGRDTVLILDPERQVAGYLVRSRTASYVLDTARTPPEEGSTNGPAALRPGTTYHFIISAPARAAGPGEDEDDVPISAQYAGTFTTRQ